MLPGAGLVMVSLKQICLRHDAQTSKRAGTRVGRIVGLGGIRDLGRLLLEKGERKDCGISSLDTPKIGFEEGAERRGINGGLGSCGR